ncbi:MAG: hypothetical protein Q4D98_11275 [Planctomycetia bacterium]|nr:hypothetical protein [Planctomycetia bacterium]
MVKKALQTFLLGMFFLSGTAFAQLPADTEMQRAVAVFEKTIQALREMKARSEQSGKMEMAAYLQKKIDLAEKYIAVKKLQIPLMNEIQKTENELREIEFDASSGDNEAIRKEQDLRRKRQKLLDDYARLQSEANALLTQFSTVKFSTVNPS